MLICLFFCVESMSENTDSATLPLQLTLWLEVGLHLNGPLSKELHLIELCNLVTTEKRTEDLSLTLHNVHSFALN